MATYKGKEGILKVGTDLVGEVRNFELTVTANEVDTSKMGDDWTGTDSTQKSWSFTAEVHFDPDDLGQTALAVGDKAAIEFYPQGETTGNVLESGSALITSISRPQAHDNIIMKTIEGKGDGALTVGAVV